MRKLSKKDYRYLKILRVKKNILFFIWKITYNLNSKVEFKREEYKRKSEEIYRKYKSINE